MTRAQARPTPWRGEYENDRTFEYVRLKLINLKLWGVVDRSPVPRCAAKREAALHTLDQAVSTIAHLDAQTAPASKRRWKKAKVAELTRLLGEAQAVVEGRSPIGLVKSADGMVDIIVESRRKQGATSNDLPTPVLRNIARLIGAGGVCGLEDLVVQIYQKKYAGRSSGRFNASVKKLSDSWPACVHCGAPVDDRASPPIHYWTEERDCRDNRGRKLGTLAKPVTAGRSTGATGRKIVATSFERYNGGVRVKRAHGSSTVTRFYVHFADEEHDPSKWKEVEGYGPTPGDRKTDAIRRSGLLEG